MEDAGDSKSPAPCGRAGSTPVSGTSPFLEVLAFTGNAKLAF